MGTYDFESGVTGWNGAAFGNSITSDTTQHFTGTKSGKITWDTGAYYTNAVDYLMTGFTIGLEYEVELRVKIPTGMPRVQLDNVITTQLTSPNGVYDYWESMWFRFTATAVDHWIRVVNFDPTTTGDYCYIDSLQWNLVPAEPETVPALMTSNYIPIPGWADTLTLHDMIAQFREMKRVGITEIIPEQAIDLISNIAYYPTAIPGYSHGVDVIGMVLDAAEEVGIDVIMPTGRYNDWTSHGADATWMANVVTTQQAIVTELEALYSGRFVAWYLAMEVEDLAAGYTPNQTPMSTFFTNFHNMIQTVTPGIPTMVSPYNQNLMGTAHRQYASQLAKIFKDIDIIALQDSGGYATAPSARNAAFIKEMYRAMYKATLGQNELWDNPDMWHSASPWNGGPMAPATLQANLEAASPFVSKIVGFSFMSQLWPQQGASQYASYLAYADYAGITLGPITSPYYSPAQVGIF